MPEFELLRHIFAANPGLDARVLIPPGDDMAMIDVGGAGHGGRRILLAVDQLIDGRHVRLEATPIELVGRKAVARSLSDVAAMAGRPLASLAAVTLPRGFGDHRAKALFDSMRATAEQYRCPLVGGDIAVHREAQHPLTCSITVLAEPLEHPRGPVRRDGAQVGDTVYVTGWLGGSLKPDGLGRHLTFEPRIDVALHLASSLGDRLHAMIDLSDGLGRDAAHIAELSHVQIELDAARIPCTGGCDWRRALGDGEDYELCFCADAGAPVPAQLEGVPIATVGRVVPRAAVSDPLVVVKDADQVIRGESLGWQHG